jgi:hypothetical protein
MTLRHVTEAGTRARSGTQGKSAQAMRQYSLLKVFSPFPPSRELYRLSCFPDLILMVLVITRLTTVTSLSLRAKRARRIRLL